jgi:WD40 repeat protein
LNFHPTESKALVFAGDKYGNLGIFDSANSVVTQDPDDEESPDVKLAITQLKVHTKSITSIQFRPDDHSSVYSASYDSSIRKLDLAKEMAVEVFAPSDDSVDEGITYMQLIDSEPHMVYFTTLDGRFGTHDTRVAANHASGTTLYGLSEKKIGGFSIHPSQPYLLATASLDRTLKLWDLRKIEGKGENRSPILIGEHISRLSVSTASFNHLGQVATTSYDDTIKIYDFNPLVNLAVGKIPDEENFMEPKHIIRHNNQTGRWVTM